MIAKNLTLWPTFFSRKLYVFRLSVDRARKTESLFLLSALLNEVHLKVAEHSI